MRRHHFLSLQGNPAAPPDNISLLIGAEAEQRRRRSTQLPLSPGVEIHRRLTLVFGGTIPGTDDQEDIESADEGEEATPDDNEETGSGFLGRVNSYSRLMHAHTRSQLRRPTTGTLPSYRKTMHAFTMNQLNHQRATSHSETSSPHTGAALSMPAVELSKLTLDELPPGPSNTPAQGGRVMLKGVLGGENQFHGIDFRKLRRRSLTDPEVVRRKQTASDVSVRDFAQG